MRTLTLESIDADTGIFLDMFHGIGTALNITTIIIGSTVGILIGERLKERTRDLITDVLGLVTMLGAAAAIAPIFKEQYKNAIPNGWTSMPILFALLIGGAIGSALNLEARFEDLGDYLRRKFRSKQSTFVEGFIDSSLLFVIGPLAILGSISDGMGSGVDQLILKSSLDFFASMAFASTLGWGVSASIIPVALYQGTWTILGFALGSVLSQYQIDAMTVCGGLMLVGIALRLLDMKRIPVANLLPALIFSPLIATAIHHFS